MTISKLIIFTAFTYAAAASDTKSYPHTITSEGIVGHGLVKVCVGLWDDDTKGLIGFIKRLKICSMVLPMTK